MDTVLIIKVVSALLYPLGLVSVLAIFSILCRLCSKYRTSAICFWLAVLVLFVSSNPMVARSVVASLEDRYPQHDIDSISKHDAIIVLGGGLRIPTAPAKHVQLAHASDRYWYAVQLFNAGKADKIIISGGNVYPQSGLQGEAYYAAQVMQTWGVPENAIELESNSRTTAQNQSFIKELLEEQEIQSVLLVTSAIHMPRAHHLFMRLPITVTPASADVLVRNQNSPEIFNYIPSAAALRHTTAALHEYYGYWFESLTGE